MRARRHARVRGIAIVLLLTGCGSGGDPTVPDAAQPPPRTSWALRHRVEESENLRVVSNSVGQYDESTGVQLGRSGDACYSSVSRPGQGGPDLMVGEKVPTRFRGAPAVRNGSGAEGAYLMWQLPDGSWVEVSCDDPDDPDPVDTVAAAVRLTAASVSLPFDLTALPDGYGVSQILQHRAPAGTTVYVGRLTPQRGFADSDIEIEYETAEPTRQPGGRAITVRGGPARLDEDPKSPQVCVAVQGRYVCVGIAPSDTGPYPDRSAEIPILLDLAGALRFADLDDRSTWFTAEEVFG